ncbi:MAG: glucosaminidase domain-containing protein [Magnetovibrio sp.]|nr:glucosaminidase domain-containing protein [Magnetovibrio sp.]
MTGRFERGILFTAGALVTGLIGLALLDPPRSETAAPKATLEFPMTESADAEPALPAGIVRIKAVGTAAESLVGGIDVRALDNGHRAVDLHTAKALSKTFQRIGYDLDSVKTGNGEVPRLFLASLPADLDKVRETKLRKSIFFKTILPLVLQVNEEVLADRRRLWDLTVRLKKGEQLPAVDRLWLIVMTERYGVKRGDMSELMRRVDIVPPSMALAQAAEESGWGTSRFSKEGNAIFGQWTFSDALGLVPKKREAGKKHRVRAFKSLLHSVRSYLNNLNTHRAYRGFRTARESQRRKGGQIGGTRLVDTLTSYSERGGEYVKTLRSIITANNLSRLDGARLSGRTRPVRPLI